MVLSMSILFPKFHACQAKTKQTNKQKQKKNKHLLVSGIYHSIFIDDPVKNLSFASKLLLRTSMMHYCRDTTCGRDTDPF